MVGADLPGWSRFEEAYAEPDAFVPDGETRATDPLLLYFTSGTTAQPKLVLHTHQSYPVGHLSTMYWIGLREGDVHWNISSPGWAKHAWSSTFAPWNAGATVFGYHYARFEPRRALDTIVRCGVTTLCAPPTVWRMLVGEDLGAWPVALREVVGAGEPLNPEVIERVRRAWGLTIRDGYGQTETTAQVGNPPGQPVKPGSMGRPLPGYRIVLLNEAGAEADEGEIVLPLDPPPLGLMEGYLDDASRSADALRAGVYHTGDVAERDADGYITYVGRADDVFKSSDYRISPFELESALVEHPHVAEAAVVPSPDPVRLSVPKAFVVLAGRRRRRRARWRWRCSGSSATGCRATSGSDASSSPSCRRPSRARSAGWTCARSRPAGGGTASGWSSSSGRRIFRSSGAALELKRLLDPAQHELHGERREEEAHDARHHPDAGLPDAPEQRLADAQREVRRHAGEDDGEVDDRRLPRRPAPGPR